MKKNLSLILSLFILSTIYCPLFGQSLEIEFDQAGILNTIVEPESVNNPAILKQWTPRAAEPPYLPNPKGKNNNASTPIIQTNPVNLTPNIPQGSKTARASGSNAKTLGIVLGTSIPVGLYTGALTFLLLRKGPSVSLPPIVGSTNLPLNTSTATPFNANHSFKFGEEVLYYLILEDTSQTPISEDTVVYIKLPPWLKYEIDSTTLNNNNLTDKTDEDLLNYFEDESLLLLNLGPIKNDNRFIINFAAKVLTQNVSIEEAFCEIKVQSIKNNTESDWFKINLLPQKTIPKNIENLIIEP